MKLIATILSRSREDFWQNQCGPALALETGVKTGHAGCMNHICKSILFFALSIFGSYFSQAATDPIIIGHRGASGHRPEHTIEAYKLAIEMGADYIEPDLVSTKDGVLIARHENEISGTTDVAEKFPDRKKTKTIDGESITGWFTEDFTLAEIKQLKAKERLAFRNQSYNGKFDVPTFKEVVELAIREGQRLKRKIGIYPETKHPTYFQSIGLALEEPLVKILSESKLNEFNSPVFIQSFEYSNLKKLKGLTQNKLVFLFDDPEKVPFDMAGTKNPLTYIEYTKPEQLKELAKTVYGIGPYKRYIIPTDKDGKKLPTTSLVQDAKKAGLAVHPYTFRSEKSYLISEYKEDPTAEYLEFFKVGVNGVFSDFPDDAVRALNLFKQSKKNSSGVKK